MIIIARNDLKMSKGKLAAQVAHAAVTCALRSKERQSSVFHHWYDDSQKKVVVKVESEKELFELQKIAQSYNLVTAIIKDAGHTQLEHGTTTCLGIGPATEDDLNRVTGHLKLMG